MRILAERSSFECDLDLPEGIFVAIPKAPLMRPFVAPSEPSSSAPLKGSLIIPATPLVIPPTKFFPPTLMPDFQSLTVPYSLGFSPYHWGALRKPSAAACGSWDVCQHQVRIGVNGSITHINYHSSEVRGRELPKAFYCRTGHVTGCLEWILIRRSGTRPWRAGRSALL